ncbi:hypothetical protein HBI56_058470 [Parastagonospora nodorum]|uniref:Uncharacterized protein n=1 Tax=Phaeosphaeria nodorum (strain SN15 / ATCC MYA-4574 / FGSC 10173) TaxID=321614 RepID=A0A7U2F1Y8_PHANO|nr:hypothetical protein HBH56_160170 [Parastagonospora nodorum]QRC97239.1 hypothetical protein JI435_089670 [Parastagonospora nodorum SN15]KAH3922448.1 hypothetical protein HBH54_224600 [Parastagonospora nodorum]KAH3947052.1 hypothetical protein HBH53_121740 [Parastagonospora nodorum]KAH3969785.1 hypothetical protein HBH52_169750 [Parastagonospora nodorum]
MGRGAYDNTDASQPRSSAAASAIDAHHAKQARSQREAEAQQAVQDEAKMIRSKKSRGIMAARRAAKEQKQGVSDASKDTSKADQEHTGQK